jgi:hypothetical protein
LPVKKLNRKAAKDAKKTFYQSITPVKQKQLRVSLGRHPIRQNIQSCERISYISQFGGNT